MSALKSFLSFLPNWIKQASGARRLLPRALAAGSLAVLLTACGGGGIFPNDPPAPVPPPPDPAAITLASGNASGFEKVVVAVPAGSGGTTSSATLTVHYQRLDGVYTGWQLHSWGVGKDPGWNVGYNPTSNDSFGAIYSVPLNADSGSVGYLFHKGDTKDHGSADQSYTLTSGRNEIWRIQDDATTYTSNPSGLAAPDLNTLRVHYKRFDSDFSVWGLHLWDGGGIDVASLKSGVVINSWDAPVLFSAMNGYSAVSSGEVMFDIPLLNPTADANRKSVEFIIHGTSANSGGTGNKDGWSNNIHVDFAALTITAGIGEIWLVQAEPTVYTSVPDSRSASTTDAKAYWLNGQLIQWPKVDSTGVFKLYYAATGQIVSTKDSAVTGADGFITLDANTVSVPSAAAQRFKYIGAGVVLAVKAADQSQLPDLLTKQVVVVQEDSAGKVQNATTAQLAGVLDALYSSAASVTDLGVSVSGGNTVFKVWAPTAQKLAVFTYDSGTGEASSVNTMTRSTDTGVWSASVSGDQSGKYYKFIVQVFVRGKGLIHNLVTDPYSVSLTTDSKRSYIANLESASLKPEAWDSQAIPNTVLNPVDMSIYELHVRDFSANDSTVPAAQRGKYLAFTNTHSNGMKHLKALADAGLTDVHLLPIFDIATVPESGCVTPSISNDGAATDTQQLAVNAAKSADCFNWGYDPYHYSAPEGSYASDAADGAKRILETRQMVMALHQTGLRVGMDVVYNHTTASGQTEKSVLDRVVPGYYHRLNATGDVEKSTCCDNTATENLMMAKLMTDSVSMWAKQYKIDSFRFDLMGHQPRAVMVDLKAQVNAAAGHEVQIIGEGWNYGEVANGTRFEQASQLSLNGTGIGTFSDRARDHIRGGSPFDSGANLVKNQGFINGLTFDDNGSGSTANLKWSGDIIKSGLAGSIRDFSLTTHWDSVQQLQQLDYNGQAAGYVTEPQEVVNYIENHDNQTLFDINAYKLPITTSKEDRARVQMLGVAINAFSQGISYYHAGVDTLRSKSMDRNSYDSGDWFNRLDWTYSDNFFATGLPMQADNEISWPTMSPLLNNSAIKPTGTEIVLARDMFRDFLKIRASTSLLRLRSATDIKTRLHFYNTGSTQISTVLVGHIEGSGYAGAGFQELVYLINVDKVAHDITVDALKSKAFVLHPIQAAAQAADTRAKTSSYTSASGTFSVPARTAVVYVVQ
jgi:pullulanase-type alpha-1,6-glucosidase